MRVPTRRPGFTAALVVILGGGATLSLSGHHQLGERRLPWRAAAAIRRSPS